MAKTSPTTRSTVYLRKLGFLVGKAEQTLYMPGARFPKKKDMFGFGDLLVSKPGIIGATLVQVTDASSIVARVNKILGIPKPKDRLDQKIVEDYAKIRENAEKWLRSENRILVHGWAKRGPRGTRKIWTLTERELTLSDFQEIPPQIPA